MCLVGVYILYWYVYCRRMYIVGIWVLYGYGCCRDMGVVEVWVLQRYCRGIVGVRILVWA